MYKYINTPIVNLTIIGLHIASHYLLVPVNGLRVSWSAHRVLHWRQPNFCLKLLLGHWNLYSSTDRQNTGGCAGVLPGKAVSPVIDITLYVKNSWNCHSLCQYDCQSLSLLTLLGLGSRIPVKMGGGVLHPPPPLWKNALNIGKSKK